MATVRSVTHRLLKRHGVTTIFGNPGSNELPFLKDLPGEMSYYLGLHEGVVVGMADGYAQASGRTPLVNLHAAAGTGNAMGALTNAVYSRTPLLLTAGQQVRAVVGMEAMLANVDAARLTDPLVGWSAEPLCAADVPRTISQALLHARAHRTAVYVSVPYDDWDAEVDDAGLLDTREVRVAGHLSTADAGWLVDAVTRASRPVLVLGGDVDRACQFGSAVALAERLDCPVWAAPSLWRLPFPNRHRLFRGVLPAGIASISRALQGHDLALVIGAPVFRYHQHEPGDYLPPDTRLIQVTDDLGAATRAPMGEALVADLPAVFETLLHGIPNRADGAAPADAYRPGPAPLPAPDDPPYPPEAVFATLRDTLPADTAYVVESTATNAAWWDQMDLRHPGSYYFPAAGGLGFGMPATVGVGLASPQRRVVGVIGDGSANYGITALWSAARYSVPVTFVILRNGTYGALRWFAGLLDVRNAPGLDIPDIDFVAIAGGYGVDAVHASDLAELRAAPDRHSCGPAAAHRGRHRLEHPLKAASVPGPGCALPNIPRRSSGSGA